MKKKIIIFSSIGGAILIGLTILIICLCLPKGDKTYRNIKVFSVTNNVNVIRNNNTLTASKDMKLKNEDTVEVKEESSAVLKLDNDKFIMAKENTTLKLVASGKDKNTKTRILVEKGGVIVEVKEKLKDEESFEIASSNSVMAIRGTQISFDVVVKDNKITTSFAILDGNTEILLLKNEKLSKTTLTKDFRMSYTTDINDSLSVDDISKLVDKAKTVVDIINDNDLKEVFNVIKEELTSEEIDSIVDAINDFEREDKVNGVIKFKNSVNELEYSKNPKEVFITDKEYNGLEYYYSSSIDGEYKLYTSDTTFEVGEEIYLKAISADAYRSDPFKVTITKLNLNLDIKLSQNIYEESMYSANIIVSVEDEEFFNTLDAKKLDEYGQPINYVLCKVTDRLGINHYAELNYRNKTITFDSEYFDYYGNSNYKEPIYTHGPSEIEFEYHIDNEKYVVKNEEVMTYSFKKEISVDNIMVYYDKEIEGYYLQLTVGAVCPENINELLGATEFFEMDVMPVDPAVDTDAARRIDLYVNTSPNQAPSFRLDDTYHSQYLDNGKFKFWVIALATVASGDPYGIYLSTDEYNVDINNVDTTKPIPDINVMSSGYFITYNTDGTVNVYVDLQYGYQDGDTELGDYVVRYNVKDSSQPDIYVRGSGRFLALEHIVPNNYEIKQVIALDKEVDGVIYGLNAFNEAIDISAGVSGIYLNSTTEETNVINTLSFGFSDSTDGKVLVIDSLGNSNEYISQDGSTEAFGQDVNYAIVYIDCNKMYDSAIINDIVGEEILPNMDTLTDDEFSLLKTKMKEKYGIEIEGSNKGKLSYKIYFETKATE